MVSFASFLVVYVVTLVSHLQRFRIQTDNSSERYVVKFFVDRRKPRPKLIGFCTDNPNVNKGMRKLIEQSAELQTYGVLPYGCGCHS